jgi:hypothetical protein
MIGALKACRKYLDFHHLRSQVFDRLDKSILIQYTVAEKNSRHNSEEGNEWQLEHLFINTTPHGKYRLIIIIHEAWFSRCEHSTENNNQEHRILNEEFNLFVIKILNDIRSKLPQNRIRNQIPSFNSPPQPPSESEMGQLIGTIIDELTTRGGPDFGEQSSWISPTHGYSFG